MSVFEGLKFDTVISRDGVMDKKLVRVCVKTTDGLKCGLLAMFV